MKRVHSFDTLKGICLVGVLFIHSCFFLGINDIVYFVTNTTARVVVPLFFMMTGYFYYQKQNKQYTNTVVKKYFKKYIVWFLLYFFLASSYQIQNIGNNFLNLFPLGFIYVVFPSEHLWYLIALVISLVVVGKLLQHKLLKRVFPILCLIHVIGVFVPVLIDPSYYIYTRDALFMGIFYISLGACMNHIHLKVEGYWIVLLFMIQIAERHAYTILFLGSGDYYISTIGCSICIFLYFLQHPSLGKDKFITKIGKYSLEIYLIHIIIMQVCAFLLGPLFHYGIAWQFVYPIITLGISYFLVSVYKEKGKRK